MTEPQVWVLIGVFATAVLGMMSWQTISFNRTIRTEIGRIDTKIDALEGKMGARFEIIERRLDYLDRDVQLIMKREFGEPG